MEISDKFVCETRYCPECGGAIFCRSESDGNTAYFLTEDMATEITYCPECHFDLGPISVEVLMVEPARAKRLKKTPAKKPMGKKELIEALMEKAPDLFGTKAAAEKALNTIEEIVVDLLASGEDVRLAGLGSFKVKETKARTGRNPQTGETMDIPAKKKVRFSPAKALKEKLKD